MSSGHEVHPSRNTPLLTLVRSREQCQRREAPPPSPPLPLLHATTSTAPPASPLFPRHRHILVGATATSTPLEGVDSDMICQGNDGQFPIPKEMYHLDLLTVIRIKPHWYRSQSTVKLVVDLDFGE
jgi:hypothetical protein